MIVLKVIICYLLLQLSATQSAANFTKPCYKVNYADDQSVWLLQWEDNFERKKLTETNEWDVQHESHFCGGNGIEQESCNVQQNVHLISGTLSLWAQKEKEDYLNKQFTAATVTTKGVFSYGRWEFRAALPMGNQIRATVFTRNDNESYWHEFGQMDLFANTGDPIIFRGVHFANSSGNYKPNDYILDVPLNEMNAFHLYGIEWNETGVQFFLNNNYSKVINFNKASNGMVPNHNIRIQIGVGGKLFAKKIPENFDQLRWKCPAFIIDYVRVFEKVSKENVVFEKFSKCENILNDTEKSNALIQNICALSMNLMKNKNKFFELQEINWLPIVIVILLVLFLILLTYLIYQIVKVKRRVTKDVQLSPNGNDLEYYENVYDDVNPYSGLELREQPGNKLSYVQLQDGIYSIPGNDYLEVKDDYYRKNTVQTEQSFNRPGNEYENPILTGEYDTLTQNISKR